MCTLYIVWKFSSGTGSPGWSQKKARKNGCGGGGGGYVYIVMPSVLWYYWLGVRKNIRPVKIKWWGAGVVICLECANDLHMVQLMALPPWRFSSLKSRLVQPFRCQLTQVLLENRLLNGCMSLCMFYMDILCSLLHLLTEQWDVLHILAEMSSVICSFVGISKLLMWVACVILTLRIIHSIIICCLLMNCCCTVLMLSSRKQYVCIYADI